MFSHQLHWELNFKSFTLRKPVVPPPAVNVIDADILLNDHFMSLFTYVSVLECRQRFLVQ